MKTVCAVLVGIVLGYGLALGCRGADESQAAPARHRRGPAAPPQSAEELNTPLAKVDDVTITIGELEERINRQSPYVRARYTSLEQKRDFLESLIQFEILAKEAYRRGYDKDPEVIRTMKGVMIQKLMRDELDQRITAESITDDEMKAYYQANLADFVKPTEVRASAIILKSKAQAQRVLLDARGEAGKTNTGFRELVAKYSVDRETKLRGGDLRYFDAGDKDLPAPVVTAAFALAEPGDVSDVIAAGNGSYYILKLTGRHKATALSYDQAKPQIRNTLFRTKRLAAEKTLVDELRAKAKVEIDEANLAKVRIDTSNAVDDGRPRDLVPPPPSLAGPGATPAAPGAGATGSGATVVPAAGSAVTPPAGNPRPSAGVQ